MLRSFVLAVLVIGLTAYLVVKSRFGDAPEMDSLRAENGPAVESFEETRAPVPAPATVDPGSEEVGEPESGTPPSRPEATSRQDGSVPEEARPDDAKELAARSPVDLDAPLSFAFARPGGGTVRDREQARQEAKEMVARAEKADSALSAARFLTRALLSGGLEPSEDQNIYESLMKVHRSGLLNPRNVDGCFVVEVGPRDSLWAICNRLEREGNPPIAPGLIQHLNGMGSPTVREGQKLKVPVDPLSIEIVKGRYLLQVFVGDVLLRRFEVGLGKFDRPTPEGTFRIEEKTENPAWDGPEGRIPFGDKANPLGTRWMSFEGSDGYGIHGTWDSSSIRGNESNGCIRMRNEDVEFLFNLVPRKTKVVILP